MREKALSSACISSSESKSQSLTFDNAVLKADRRSVADPAITAFQLGVRVGSHTTGTGG
jgi:hypothetical protein